MGEAKNLGRVLVVDDEPGILRAYQRILTGRGFQVECAEGGETAVSTIAGGSAFDAIITDVSMPGLSGLDFMAALRQHDEDVPVLVVTGSPNLESAVIAMEHGAFRYFTKPVDADTLIAGVTRAVRIGRTARERRQERCQYGSSDCRKCGACPKLARAIETVRPAFQPIVSWKSRSIFGYEGLVRSAEPGLDRPDALFSLADRERQLDVLGRRIRARMAESAEALPDGVALFVNVHPTDVLDPTLFDQHSPLSRFASRIVLEITERSSLATIVDIAERLKSLRELGYRIAVDDLGAGYAGLSSFSLLEPDIVKLDMSLVREIDRSERKQRVVRSLLSLCQSELGIPVVCEGIETLAERDAVVSLGGDLLQGYLFARPASVFPDPAPASLEAAHQAAE